MSTHADAVALVMLIVFVSLVACLSAGFVLAIWSGIRAWREALR